MEDLGIQIKLLTDLVVKKQTLLETMYNIVMNQQTLWTTEEKTAEIATFFKEMNVQKQSLMDEIATVDELFQKIYQTIALALDQDAKKYTKEVQQLQTAIRLVTDWDVKLRVAEDQNRQMFQRKSMMMPEKITPTRRQYILEQYQKAKTKK